MKRNQRFRCTSKLKSFEMKVKQGVIVLMFLILAGMAYADATPTIGITSQPSTTVDVTVVLSGTATDLIDPPMIAGIREINLYEDNQVIYTYNCGDTTVCPYSKSVTHATAGNRTYYATAKDKGNNIGTSASITIEFRGPNLPPNMQNIPDQTVSEDSGTHDYLIDLWNFTTDDRLSPNQLTYTLFWQENTTLVNCVIDNNQYVNCTLPTLHAFGNTIITIQASDGQLFDRENITITVESVNDAPWLNLTISNLTFPEDSYNDSVNLSNHFKDIETAYLTYSFIPSNVNISVTETAGIMNITSAQDYFGISSLIIIASDGENATNTTIVLTVLPVNDAPYFNPGLLNQNAIRFLPFMYDINASDVDPGDILTYFDNTTLFDINPATGLINFTPTTYGNYSINITVCDDSGAVNDCTSSVFNLEIIYIPRPGFVNNTPLNATYEDPGYYELFITIIPSSVLDTVLFEFNGINTTASLVSGNTYKINLTELAVGNHNYRWHANYTNSLSNTSQQYVFTILPATPQLILSIQPALSVEYGTLTNVSCYSNTSQSQSMNLYRDLFIVSNPDINNNLAVGSYNYTCYLGVSQNYTDMIQTQFLNITPKTVVITLNAPATVPYGNPTNVNCSIDTNLTTPVLTRNGTIVSNPDNSIISAGKYNYTCYILPASPNFNSITQSKIVTVTKQQGIATLNAPTSVTYGSSMNVNCTINNNQSILQFQRNKVNITTNPDFGPLAAGQYNYTCNAIESQNYTGDSKSASLIVNPISSALNLTLNTVRGNLLLPATGGMVSILGRLITPATGYIELYVNNSHYMNLTGSFIGQMLIVTSSMPVSFVFPANATHTGANETHWVFVGTFLSRNFAPPINTFFNKSYFTLNLTTNLNTSCNWSLNSLNINNLFDPTGGTFHQASITGMKLGQNNVYVACLNDSIISNLSYTVQNIIEQGSTLINGASASNSIIYETSLDNSVSMDSKINQSTITDSSITRSTLINCTVTNSTVKDYVGSNCIITNSIVDPSDVTGSTITGSIIMNSNATYSSVDNSQIHDSNVDHSTIINSYINKSTISYATLINVTATRTTITNTNLQDAILIDAIIINGVITAGTITQGSITYNASINGTANVSQLINLPPTAVITAPTTGTPGAVISFDASQSTDPNIGQTGPFNDSTLTYQWNFGEGNTSIEQTTSHTYNADASYVVTLTVTDAYGLNDTTTQTITVSTPSSPPPPPSGGGSSGGGGGGGGYVIPRTYTYDLDSGMHFQRSLTSYDTLLIKYKQGNHSFKIASITKQDVTVLVANTASRLINKQILKYDLDGDHYYDMEVTFLNNYQIRAEFRLRPVQELVPGYSPFGAQIPEIISETPKEELKEQEPEIQEEIEKEAEETAEKESVLSKFWSKFKSLGSSVTGAVVGVSDNEEVGGTTGMIILLAVVILGIFLYWIYNEWF